MFEKLLACLIMEHMLVAVKWGIERSLASTHAISRRLWSLDVFLTDNCEYSRMSPDGSRSPRRETSGLLLKSSAFSQHGASMRLKKATAFVSQNAAVSLAARLP